MGLWAGGTIKVLECAQKKMAWMPPEEVALSRLDDRLVYHELCKQRNSACGRVTYEPGIYDGFVDSDQT